MIVTNRKEKLLDGNDISDEEFGPFYKGYVDKCRGENLFDQLDSGKAEVVALVSQLSDKEAQFSYEPKKWSIKETLGHMTDTERILGFRALVFARGEVQQLAGFDQDQYVKLANFNDQSIADLLSQYETVRKATCQLFESFAPDVLLNRGTASGSPFTVRALGYIIAGHELHHLEILKTRYIPALKSRGD